MDSVVAYLNSIEMINRAGRRLSKRNDDAGRALLLSALDAAKAAWLLMPADWQLRLAPPPAREDYSL